MLEGFRRTAKPKRARLPITLDLLSGILTKLSAVCRDGFESTLFSSAFTLAFFGFFRIGELTTASKSDRAVDKIINLTDIKLVDKEETLLIKIRYSKADQRGKGCTIKIKKQQPQTICPVLAFKRYLAVRPKSGGSLFCHVNGLPLTRYQFSAILNKCLRMINPGLECYTAHSFRLGAASWAAKVGWSTDQIKLAGRWASEVYKVYIQKV
jgi:integrase